MNLKSNIQLANNKFLLAIFCVLIGCANRGTSLIEMSVITYSTYSLIEDKDKPIEVKNTIEIAFYKDYTLYRTTYTKLRKITKDGSLTTDVNLNDTVGVHLHKYYLIKKGDGKGLVYDSLSKKKEYDYDNFLKYEGLRAQDNGFLSVELGEPDNIQRNKVTKELEIEKFNNKTKKEGEPDSLYRYYSKDLNDINFSFNPVFDKRAKSKFWKVALIYNSIQSSNKSLTSSRSETYWKFERSNLNDKATLQKYFDDFIVEREKRNLK